MNKIARLIAILVLLAATGATPVYAQRSDQPVYLVQPGDTLATIALRFGISVQDLADANGIADINILSQGQPLVIPGLEGVSGVLETRPVPYGENLTTLSRRLRLDSGLLVRLNHLTSPAELYAGANLILPQVNPETELKRMVALRAGETALEAAARSGSGLWALAAYRGSQSTWDLLPGERYYLPGAADAPSPSGAISPAVKEIRVSKLPLVQGKTAIITVTAGEALQLSGALAGNPLRFFDSGDNVYDAIQGVHAMIEPGLYPLSIKGVQPDGTTFEYEQMMLVQSGYYPKDPPLTVDPETLDPDITRPEDDQVLAVVTPATPQRYWDGIFIQPVGDPVCIKSWYGDRRSYNGSDYTYFHTGLDYGYCALQNTLAIYAAAPGVVVFTGELTVRGIATLIDHGWGVYTGYWHQKSIAVKVGDKVEAGQQIGEMGATGRVNGPHLHFEVWANGVQVNPEDWLENAYP
jgi:murein DD-endopeptidase MepM/ murein hydrolase activator NlpD